MRVLLQRVTRARVTVGTVTVGEIGRGLLLFAGATHHDRPEDADFLAAKVANLRVFADDARQMNRSLLDLHRAGEQVAVMVVSQFTLYADARKGRRPSFVGAARPERAEPLVARLVTALRAMGPAVAEGSFGATMAVESVNDGPVTLWLDTADLRQAVPPTGGK